MAVRNDLKQTAPFLSRAVRKTLKTMDISKLTEIQQKAIVPALNHEDVLGIANTGSGKTLAFLIPAVQMLLKTKDLKSPRVLVISPTRELAMQTSRVAKKLLAAVPGAEATLLVGGTKKSEESALIKQGSAILVCTPGRLLDHLVSGLSLQKIKMVVLDESDRILDIGFERNMLEILSYIPKKRQTLMFSATATPNALTRAWLSRKHAVVEVKEDNQVTAVGLQQSYIVCPEEKRFSVLFSLLKSTSDKIIVFFSTCASVVYHGDLFTLLKFNVGLLHSGVKQDRRARVFDSFCSGDLQILFSTDVAARGLDVPGVSWIVQYDPPTDPKEYIHRVGRTARAGSTGKALLFLLPSERIFIQYLKHLEIVVEEWVFSEPKDITDLYIKTVSNNYYLEKSAKEALRSYLQAYAGHKLKKVFDATKIELHQIARSFGLNQMPNIDITIGASKK
ncbi:ATP-dependent RNA helicase DDX18/HAS1 [Nematocida homosporus]|uniref:ATP-dependent RNA helicase DDX18/HAS1 n=1 Tax=Nematocida homosporus TaxID=1912981 RepID=UPI00221EDA2C|nr:ATP-dependent RNA helicase DDX18/HAS1 [Nematocida homosporus]KAI5187540.1 ATP-dependent RNA helicase DDX18/HAS1 [Nematocida homosporus]